MNFGRAPSLAIRFIRQVPDSAEGCYHPATALSRINQDSHHHDMSKIAGSAAAQSYRTPGDALRRPFASSGEAGDSGTPCWH